MEYTALGLDTMNPKTAPQFEAFGSSLFALIRYYKDSKMYPTLLASFLKTLCSNPNVPEEVVKSLEQAIVEAQNKFLEAQREPKKAVKPKQQVSAKALKDADSSDEEEEAGGNSQLYSEADVATAAAKKKQEEQKALADAKRVKEAAEEAAKRREENERKLAEKQRTVNDDDVKNNLAAQGFEVLAPAAWDKKGKGGKGGRR